MHISNQSCSSFLPFYVRFFLQKNWNVFYACAVFPIFSAKICSELSYFLNMILPEFFDRCRSSWLLTNWSKQLQLLKDKRKIWLWPIQEPSLLFSLSTKCLPLLLIQTRQRKAASACHKHLLLERNDKIYTNFSDLNVIGISILIK